MNFFWNTESKTKTTLSFLLSNNVMCFLKRFPGAWKAFWFYARCFIVLWYPAAYQLESPWQYSDLYFLTFFHRRNRIFWLTWTSDIRKGLSVLLSVHVSVWDHVVWWSNWKNTIRVYPLLVYPNTGITIYSLFKCLLLFCTLTPPHKNT
jgi:hypothetical protein